MTPEERLFRTLGARLARVENRLKSLEGGGRARQLTNSSIDFSSDEEDTGGLEVRVDDAPMAVWGKHPDGTVATVYLPGPPPPAPAGLSWQPLGAAVLVHWDGTFTGGVPRPADFRYVEVHASDEAGFVPGGVTKRTTILDTEADGGSVALDAPGPLCVVLVAVSTSGVRSEPSVEVEATPGPVVAEGLLDAIVGPEHLTPDLSDTVTVAAAQAAQAILDAANAQATADGAISTYFQEDPPAGLNNTTDLGDLWYRTSTQQAHRWDGTQWLLIQDNAIAEALAAAQNAQDTADGKIESFFSDTPPAGASVGDLWYDSNQGNRVSRWNGTAWAPLPFGTQALVARSITAALIAVGGIIAENIGAGEITASKLAAVLVLASTFIAGTPGGRRLELTLDGLTQYDEDSNPLLYFGSAGNNYLAVQGFETTTRHNRCANPKLANDSTGWNVFQATGSRVSGTAFGTAWAWRATDTGATTTRSDISFTNLAVAYGEELMASIDMRSSYSGSFRLGWNWKTDSGSIINSSPDYGASVSVSPGSIYRLSAPGRVPDGATKADVVLTVNADMAAAAWFEATRLLVESGTQVGGYFDGDGTVVPSDNLMTNPGFESGLTGWYQAGSNTLTYTGSAARSGYYGGLVVDDQSGGNTHYVGTAGEYPVSAGTLVTTSVWVRRASTSDPVLSSALIRIRWYNSAGAVLSQAIGPAVSGIASTWTQLSTSYAAPADTTGMRIFIQVNTVTSATRWVMDDFSLVTQATAADAAWDGAIGSSTSSFLKTSTTATTMAALDSQGVLTAKTLLVSDPNPTFGGAGLADIVDSGPGHIVAYAQLLPSGGSTGDLPVATETNWFEFGFIAQPGRLYEVMTTNMVVRGTNVGVRLRYTTDGSTPTNSSGLLSYAGTPADKTVTMTAMGPFPGGRVRLRFSVAVFPDSTKTSGINGIVAPSGSVQGIVAWARDAGPIPAASGDGTLTYQRVWTPTWSRCFDATGVRNDNMLIVQGNSINAVSGMNRTMIGYDFGNIVSALAGATIQKVELFTKNTYSRNQDGAWAVISTHNAATPPGSFSGGASPKQYKFNKSESRWVTLDKGIGTALAAGTAKGITYGNNDYTSPAYCSQWGQIGDVTAPQLRITYAR